MRSNELSEMAKNDQEIIKLIKAGDVSAFKELVVRYKDRGFSLALRLLKNREDAEEALQDSFLRAFRGLEDFRQDAKFGTWFYRIVYNVCLTRIERASTLPIFDPNVDDEVNELLEIPAMDASPVEELEQKELASLLQQKIKTLPEQYSVVLSLFYFQQLGYEEICDVLGLPLGTVKTHLFRARTMLYHSLMHLYSSKEQLL